MKFLERIKYKIQQRKIDREAKALAIELYQLIDYYAINDKLNGHTYKNDLENSKIIWAILKEMYEILEGKYK